MTTLTGKHTQEARLASSITIRIALGLVLSAASGVMILLAFPPYGVWPLIWVAFIPYIFAQHRLLPEKWSSLGPAVALLFWLGPYLARIFGPEAPLFFRSMGVWIPVIIFFLHKERKFHELTQYRWFVLQGVIDWVGFEMIRTFIPMLATNGFVGNTLASQAWLIQPVSIFTIYGMNLVIMLTNFALAQGAMTWFDQHWQLDDAVAINGRSTIRWLIFAAAVVISWIGISAIILSNTPADAQTVRVAALQPNFPEAAHIDHETDPQLRFDTFVMQAREAAAQNAEVIFTPEMGFAFDPQVEHTAKLRALAAETDAYLFLTYVVSNDEEFRNEAVVLTPDGEFLDVYGKNHVFGEPPTPTSGVFPVYNTPFGRLATLICHDTNYTDIARKLTQNGAQLIAAPVREFGGVGEQLWTNAVFRAVENRVAVVFTGVAHNTVVIDPNGRLLAHEVNPAGERLTVVRDVPLGTGNTLFTRLGDWLGWLCLAGYIFFVGFQMVVERKAKQAEAQ